MSNDIVNISIGRQKNPDLSYLERHLAIDNVKPFKTFIGTVSSIRTVKDYITKKYYPAKFLINYPKTKEDYNLLKKCQSLKVPNIQAILVLAVIDKIKQDKQLKAAMTENTLPYMAYNKPKKTLLFGKTVMVDGLDFSLSKYCEALNDIGELLRNNKFTDEELFKIVDEAKIAPKLDIFFGTWININSVNEESETTSVNEATDESQPKSDESPAAE